MSILKIKTPQPQYSNIGSHSSSEISLCNYISYRSNQNEARSLIHFSSGKNQPRGEILEKLKKKKFSLFQNLNLSHGYTDKQAKTEK